MFKKFMAGLLILQLSIASLAQDQNNSLKSEEKTETQQPTTDPGVSLLVDVVGVSLGSAVLLPSALISVVAGAGCALQLKKLELIKAAAFGLGTALALGSTYLSAKFTWFFLKRGYKTLFPEEKPKDSHIIVIG